MLYLFNFLDFHQQNVYNLSQSKSSPKDRVQLQTLIIRRIPKVNPNIRVEALSQNTQSHDFTGFVIHDCDSNAILETFRADDIVQQRNFMAALGGTGPGIFTQNPGETLEESIATELEQIDGSLHVECELHARQLVFDSHVNNCSIVLPSYEWTVAHLPKEFYFPQDCQNEDEGAIEFAGTDISFYSPACNQKIGKPLHQRLATDTFLPPHGPAIYHPVNIGYGREIGLEPNLQAVWDTKSNAYYFLNHSTQLSFTNDPRPMDSVYKAMEEVKREEFTYESTDFSESMPVVCRDSSIVKSAANRAAKRPHGFVLKSFGRNGKPGVDGLKGQDGQTGTNGMLGVSGDGKNGMDGVAGVEGAKGCNGEKGSDGGVLNIQLRGDSSTLNLRVNGRSSTIARLGGEKHLEVVFIDCHGGDGGEGGKGGEAGAGGSGGDGGKGGKNGNGGHGGDGGMGGNGGDGGAGGDAGWGGCCIIRTLNPQLLMLVEVDCLAGNQGKGGTWGDAGEGGRRGYGGEEGSWVERDLSPDAPEGSVHTVRGMKGKPGSMGNGGSGGKAGKEGAQGKDGGILWVVESSLNKVLHQAGEKYEATITSLKVSPGLHGDLYEPNQAITVSEVVVTNTGGIPLPKGAKLFFPTTKTLRFKTCVYELPEIPPNTSFTVLESFSGRIFDQSTPNLPGCFSGEASFSPQVKLLGRPFDNSLTQTLPVAYPVKFSFALSRKNISRGEISVLEVGVENTSTDSYGSTPGCKGSVVVRLHLDSRLIPLGIQQTAQETDMALDNRNETLAFQITHNPNLSDSMWVKINELKPKEILTIPIAFLLDYDAQLCDTCVWQSDLYFKGKFVEYMSQEIRVTPAYSPPMSPTSLGDMLMVTSDLISGMEFALWQKIFNILDVNVDYWDASEKKNEPTPPERTEAEGSSPTTSAHGVSSSSSSPVERDMPLTSMHHLFSSYAGKTIIYPHCKLEQIPVGLIVSHFNSPSSNMLLFLSSSSPSVLEDYYYDHAGHTLVLRHLCHVKDRIKLPEDAHSGYHLLTPGTLVSPDVAIKKSEKKIMNKVEGDNPSQALAMFNQHGNINQKGLWKYTYGTMDIRKCPIQRSCNFQCVDETGGNLTSMGADDPLLTVKSREFPLASKFGQVLLAVMVSIPLKCKLNLFKTVENQSSQGQVKFHLPNGLHLSKQQLSAIAIAHVVADEILDCTGSVSKMKLVMEDLQENKTLYSHNGSATVVNQMLSLIQLEVLDRSKRFESPATLSAAKKIQKLCKSLSIIDVKDTFIHPERTSRMNSLPVCPPSSNSLNRALSCPDCTATMPISTPSSCKEGANTFTQAAAGSAPISAERNKGLPLLRILQDSTHVLRSHQLTVEENCYTV